MLHPDRRRVRLLVGLAVIVLLLVIVPRSSNAQTAPSLSLGDVTHSADGAASVPISASAEELATLAVFVDGEAVPFTVDDGGTGPASRVVFVVENSVSMTPVQLAQVQTEIREVAASLGSADQIGLVTVGAGATIAQPLTTDREALDAAVSSIVLDGGSALYSGVATAGDMLSGGGGPALVVLVTYGWEWGGVSTHTREESIASIQASGASVYVQSMIFDAGYDAAYLASLATDGIVHDVFQITALSDATSLLGTAAPARTLNFEAPTLALGAHELRVTSDTGAEQTVSFEVENAGLLSLVLSAPGTDSEPIEVTVQSIVSLDSVDVTASIGSTSLVVSDAGVLTVDPWAFSPGSAQLQVSARVSGQLVSSATQQIGIPTLAPVLELDQGSESTLVATLRAQPGSASELVAIAGGNVVAESTTGRLELDRPESGSLTFEARSSDGTVVLSEEVSATAVIEPATTAGDAESGGSSLLTSPVVLAVALLAVGGLFVVYRRRAGSNSEPQEAKATVARPVVAAEPVPIVREADHEPSEVEVTRADPPEPVELPKRQPDRRSRFRRGASERRQTSEPTPIHAPEWSVVVRGANGETRRVDVGYDPVSIGGSKLCTVTLDGDAVRFVHLVIAREGQEVKAHQFGPVTVNGQEANVEDEQILTDAVMEIGDVSIWLERAAFDAAVSGAA